MLQICQDFLGADHRFNFFELKSLEIQQRLQIPGFGRLVALKVLQIPGFGGLIALKVLQIPGFGRLVALKVLQIHSIRGCHCTKNAVKFQNFNFSNP